MTDFASEFKKIFSNSCQPQTDWNQPRYFDSLNNDCYGSEAALMASLTSEAYNKYGLSVYYFVKEHDTKFDPLYGEDQLENVKRRFALQVYADNIPQLQKQYQLQGMIYTEIVEVQCTIQHFAEASRYDWKTENPTAYDSIVPKIGDLMYFKYSDLYYEVLNVKEPFDVESFKETTEQIDVLDVILRHEVFDKVSLFLKNFGIMSIGMSGHDLDITFPSELANNNNMLSFFKKKFW